MLKDDIENKLIIISVKQKYFVKKQKPLIKLGEDYIEITKR